MPISLWHVLGVHRRAPTQLRCGQNSTSKACEHPASRANTRLLLMTHWRATFMLILNHEAAHEVSCATSFSRANLMHEHRTSPRQSPCAQCFSEAILVWAGLFLAYAVAQRASTRHLWCTQRFPQETLACTNLLLGNTGVHSPSPRQQFLMCINGLPRI